jgi:hypothetical protein
VLIIWESSLSAFLLTALYHNYLVITHCISFYSCTCWAPTTGVLNLAISPYYTNPLLRRWRWTGILRRGVIGCALPWLLFLWCYGVFVVPFLKRVALVFRDIIYIINILYSWQLVICEHFMSVCVEQLILGAHAMRTWFCLQNRVWH